jgi:hypothetical protein
MLVDADKVDLEVTAISRRRFQPRAHLATIALLSFIFSFIAARAFTTFFPSTVLVSNGLHIHHFWFGIALVAIGGWLGISYDDKETNRVASILYGAGGGLIVDEVGLLLTFGNYWTGLTYAFLVVFLAFIVVLMFFVRYRAVLMEEFAEFASTKVSVYLGVFLAAVSVAFIIQTDNFWVTIIASVFAVFAIILIVTFVLRQLKIIPDTKRLHLRKRRTT